MSTTNTNTELTQALQAAINMMRAVADVIQSAGEIPSGELYAILMPKMDISTYQRLVASLEGAGLIRNTNHLLTWTGPAKEIN